MTLRFTSPCSMRCVPRDLLEVVEGLAVAAETGPVVEHEPARPVADSG
jgi:hypothetical protein